MITDIKKWDKKTYEKLTQELWKQKESETFLHFTQKIVSTHYKMIGIKIPHLRKIAKIIAKTNLEQFLEVAQDSTYEEVLLQGLVISYITDYSVFLTHFQRFIQKIDNWAICDSCISSMKIIGKNQSQMIKEVKKYLQDKKEYIVRVGIVILLNYYIEDTYIDEIFSLIDQIQREEYYINMAIAWLVCECYIVQKEKTIKYLKHNHLNSFTYQKAIQKMLDSYRISSQDKEKLRQMKHQQKSPIY